jgi:hypothetical protein
VKAGILIAWYGKTSLLATCVIGLLVGSGTGSSPAIAQIAEAQAVEAQTAIPEPAAPQSRFQRTAVNLQGGSPDLRVEFAAIALAKLADAYAAEAKLAREEARESGRDVSLRGWSIAVDRYARQMPLLLQDLEQGFPVDLIVDGDKSTAVSVADRIVILSHPRLRQQRVFEQQILVEFCARYRCEQLVEQDSQSQPIPVSTRHVQPNWNFTQQKWSCSYRGISIRFSNDRNLQNARLICEQFMQEVMSLADEIAWQHRHAVPIEWEGLALQSTPSRPEHMVRLNGVGDTVLVTVPLLYGSPQLLEQIIPWIRQRLTHREPLRVELDAASYGWQEP